MSGRPGSGAISAASPRERHGHLIEAALIEVVGDLLHDRPPPPRLRDHALVGDWADHRDCHLRPDLVLIDRLIEAGRLALVRLGSPSGMEIA